MLIDGAAHHPARLMAELFHFSERRVYWRSAGAVLFLREQGHQFGKFPPCFRRQH